MAEGDRRQHLVVFLVHSHPPAAQPNSRTRPGYNSHRSSNNDDDPSDVSQLSPKNGINLMHVAKAVGHHSPEL